MAVSLFRSPNRPLLAVTVCLLLAGCGLGRSDVVVTPGADGTFNLTASEQADYAAINYQADFLAKSAQLAIDNGYRYFQIEQGGIDGTSSRTRRSVAWRIRLHDDAEQAATSLLTYRAAEVLEYGPRQEVFWLKQEAAPGESS